MIETLKGRDTRRFHAGRRVKRFEGIERQAERRLAVLDAAPTIEALAALPSNRLEALGGDRAGQYRIRINQRWRIYFVWRDGGAHDVEIVDYHN